MARPLSGPLGSFAERGMRALWEARRRAYAGGFRRPERIGARVVSIGNLTVGGAGKTTLALHLAEGARARGVDVAIVGRRYRPGPAGRSDEELLACAAVGPERARFGRSKLACAREAKTLGAALVLVDDGFSHWRLARDLDIVLVDASDPWGGGHLLPAGRLREPLRALQRADVVVLTRVPVGASSEPLLKEIARRAPAALLASARHALDGVHDLDGGSATAGGPAHVVTATGNPGAVVASAREAGFDPVTQSVYRDHHWFSVSEAAREHVRARGGRLVLTEKDAMRWPPGAPREGVCVLAVRWAWLSGGEAVERRVFDESEETPWTPTS